MFKRTLSLNLTYQNQHQIIVINYIIATVKINNILNL